MLDDGTGLFQSKPAKLIYQSNHRVVFDCEDSHTPIDDFTSKYKAFQRIILDKI